MKKFICVFLLAFSLLFMVCDNGSISPNLAIIDIANATNLFIAPSNGRSARNINYNKLFKITEDGYVQEVSYYDETGKVMTNIMPPTSVHNATDDYLIICFSQRDAYLTRKSDGAVFVLPSDAIPNFKLQNGNFKNIKPIQTDANGNIYYQVMGNNNLGAEVIKLDVSNPNLIIKTEYLPQGDYTDAFSVNPDGHIIYIRRNISGISGRIKKSNGGLYNISDGNFYIGLDGVIRSYFGGSITSYNIDSEFNITTDTVDINSKFNIITEPVNTGDLLDIRVNVRIREMYNSYILYFNNKIIIVPPPGYDSKFDSIIEVEGDNPRKIVLPIDINVNNLDYSTSYYYISGNDVSNSKPLFIRVCPITDEIE